MGCIKMADVKWIKIVTDIFDDEKIKLIDSMPERDGIIVIWFKLLCLAGKQNTGGVFLLNDKMPYTDEMFATIFNRPLNTVRLALKTFEDFGMVEIVNDTITLPHWSKHQSLDKIEKAKEKTRKRVAAHRERQKQKALAESNGYSNVTVMESNATDKEEEKEREIEKDIDLDEDVVSGALPADYNGGDYTNEDNKLSLFKDRVYLSENQLADLLDKLGLELFDEYIYRLNNFLKSTGANVKNHYETILKWYNEDRAVRP